MMIRFLVGPNYVNCYMIVTPQNGFFGLCFLHVLKVIDDNYDSGIEIGVDWNVMMISSKI